MNVCTIAPVLEFSEASVIRQAMATMGAPSIFDGPSYKTTPQ
jgi:hypothetical protein